MSTNDVSGREPNRLLHESSPYLRQHAYNPVDWHPWGEEAIAKAKELDRPIFLSVGYSSCHWCHVMERESFDDADIAALMNENFINIKVDREERPDIDSIYMHAVQLMTRQGGWPMSVFLDPDLKPFWGGTYFPPRSRMGHVGFDDVLKSIQRAWNDKRSEIEETASSMIGYLSPDEVAGDSELPGLADIARATDHASKSFDPNYGGFGPAPKFPRPIEISMLLRVHRRQVHQRQGDMKILEMCEKTLQAMALGGLYDQVGGGFHRYSTDARWLVPHFEKMLYDNALLARTYVEAYQVTGKDFYAGVAREVLDYVLREMTSSEGGFYSATDADSEGEEGVFFVWTPAELEEVLGAERAKIFSAYYGVTEAGNFEGGTSIPHVTRSLADVAEELEMSAEALIGAIGECRQILYGHREKREKPFRDDKQLTAWNALMISAFAKAAQVFDVAEYRSAAVRAADLILAECRDDGRLQRIRMDGRSKGLGFLDDYAYFVDALLDLWETTFEDRFLEEAQSLADFILSAFRDEASGGFFFTAEDNEKLIVRRREPHDSATPAAGAVACSSLLRLERLTDKSKYRDAAEAYLRSVKPLLERAPMAFGATLIALDFLVNDSVEIVVVGAEDDPRTTELLRAIWRTFLPARVLVSADSSDGAPRGSLLAGKSADVPSAWVCRGHACQAPVSTPAELANLLQ